MPVPYTSQPVPRRPDELLTDMAAWRNLTGEAAWRVQAERLKAMVAEAKVGWVAAMVPS